VRISWLSLFQLEVTRRQFAGDGGRSSTEIDWESWFAPNFVVPPAPSEIDAAHWPWLAEHVARAERITAVLQHSGLAAAQVRFVDSGNAVEAATIAAAAHFAEQLTMTDVHRVLKCDVDPFVFYANILELLVADKTSPAVETMGAYQRFVGNYQQRLQAFDFGAERIGAAVDGLADFYVSRGAYQLAQELFERRHREERHDVSVALSASRAFLAAGQLASSVSWLALGAERARELGRDDMAAKLDAKCAAIRKRMS
jgi:hypothetical protein